MLSFSSQLQKMSSVTSLLTKDITALCITKKLLLNQILTAKTSEHTNNSAKPAVISAQPIETGPTCGKYNLRWVCNKPARSTQSGHPSVGRHNE